MSRRLPVFPLPLVLLPRAPQPLHIFEPRYRQLLADALGGSREFGMLCRAPDVAEREIPPGTAGCIARIESAQTLPDGRSNILVIGNDRFTLRAFVSDPAPYHVAEVEPLEDEREPLDVLLPLAARLRETFGRVGRAARAMQDDASDLPDLPEDPGSLSFAVAQHIELELADRQGLLQSVSPGERLARLDAILSPIVESVEERALVHERAKGNGQGVH